MSQPSQSSSQGTKRKARSTIPWVTTARRMRRMGLMTPPRPLNKFSKRKFISKNKHMAVYKPVWNHQQSIMPAAYRTKLVYSNDKTLDNTAAAFAEMILSGNDIFDPNKTLGADTVAGLTELAAFYYRYRVISSRITVLVQPATATHYGNFRIYPSRLSSAAANAQIAQHHPNQVNAVVSNTDVKKLVMSATTGSLFGIPFPYDEDFTAATTGSPAQQWYWHLSHDGTANETFTAKVTIEYDVIFYDIKGLDPA